MVRNGVEMAWVHIVIDGVGKVESWWWSGCAVVMNGWREMGLQIGLWL